MKKATSASCERRSKNYTILSFLKMFLRKNFQEEINVINFLIDKIKLTIFLF